MLPAVTLEGEGSILQPPLKSPAVMVLPGRCGIHTGSRRVLWWEINADRRPCKLIDGLARWLPTLTSEGGDARSCTKPESEAPAVSL